MDFKQELIDVKWTILLPPWENICGHNLGNICHEKLKIDLERLNMLIFSWF